MLLTTEKLYIVTTAKKGSPGSTERIEDEADIW
jgi:hypothetical protein